MSDFQIPEDTLRAQAVADGITHLVTGIAIVQGKKVLALRRAPDDFLGGSFELPGGGVETGETLVESVRRETLEETGLEVDEIAGMFPGFDYQTPTKPRVRQFNFLVRVRDADNLHLSPEHDQSLWLANESDVALIEATDAMKICFRDALAVAEDLEP